MRMYRLPTYSYRMCDDDTIAAIPIENLIKPNSLVVVWCTNSPAHISSVQHRFMAKWNLKLLATWYWIKVTNGNASFNIMRDYINVVRPDHQTR